MNSCRPFGPRLVLMGGEESQIAGLTPISDLPASLEKRSPLGSGYAISERRKVFQSGQGYKHLVVSQ
jgi:hypothetical protein